MKENTGNGAGWRGARWRLAAWTAAALILLLPLFAMQFTNEVVWGLGDFAIFGALLAGACVAFELAARKAPTGVYLSAVGVALAAAFVLVWVNIAVGIIGTENDSANLMFAGVLAVGLFGAIAARFRPHGMSLALYSTALAQVLVAVIALIAGFGSAGPAWPTDILLLTGLFAGLWLISAWLFRKAARKQPHTGA